MLGTLVTSVSLKFAVNVKSKRPAPVSTGQFTTTSTPCGLRVDAVDEEAAAADADEALRA